MKSKKDPVHERDPTKTPPNTPLTIEFDVDEFRHHVEELELSEEQERELLTALWNIIVQFVDLGFGVHPVQRARATCGKDQKTRRNATLCSDPAVSFKHSILLEHFDDVASSETERAAEGFE